MGLIAAKPVKPCDGGVLGALNLLLKKERRARNPRRRSGRCGPLLLAGCCLPRLPVQPGFGLAARQPKGRNRHGTPQYAFSRSCFDSAQARQTVR